MVQRTRSKSNIVQLLGTYRSTNFANVVNHDLLYKVNASETITDFVTPGYYKLRKSGAMLPMNSASKQQYAVSSVESVWGYDKFYKQNKVGVLRLSGVSATGSLKANPLTFSADQFPPLSEHDVSAYYTDALASAKAQSMDILTFMAEFHKTVEMITGLAGRILQRSHDLAKFANLKRIKDKKAFVSAFSDSWLEYRYGWRILAYDIEAVQDMIQKLIEGLSIRFRAKKGGLESVSVVDRSGISGSLFFLTPTGSYSGSGNSFRHNYSVAETHATRCHVGVMIESTMRSLATVDPLITAIEMVPYSFVADWFTNLSNWVTAMSPLLDERLLHSYSRIDLVKTRTISIGPTESFIAGPNEVWVPFGTPSSVSVEQTAWSRTPLSEAQKQLTLTYRNRMDLVKTADLVALLWGRVRAIRKFTSI